MAGEWMSEDLSPKTRDYLAEIYRLTDRGPTTSEGFVGTSVLADLLDVSAPAVNRMITRLKESGLIDHEPYRGIRLTATGTREALKELRRHRIAETFLVKVMGFSWHEIHDEANRISTALSDMLTERMNAMAGYPTHCPHGEPIPTADGTLELPNDSLLAETPPETGTVRISRVLTRESDRLEYLEALGLIPGTTLAVLHIAPFSGPMQLKVGEEYRIIGHNLAELIRVLPVED
jgi:DtxR family transcriptional regulator, Mn-dependent transcriptional regulator